MAPAGEKKRVAILGGGMSALTTAFELTDSPNWRDQFESVTVYQMGWRLGGKGASGRGIHDRIEEHGVHIWMGFYENAFRLIRKVYSALNRPSDAPLARWSDAFTPHSYIVLGDYHRHTWKNWPLDFDHDKYETPGDPNEPPHPLPTLWQYIRLILWWMQKQMPKLPGAVYRAKKRQWSGDPRPRRIRKAGKALVDSLVLMFWAFLLGLIRILAACLPAEPRRHPRVRGLHCTHHRATMNLLTRLVLWLERNIETEMDDDDQLRRLFIVLDLAATVVVGLLSDNILFDLDGLESLDVYDFREWLDDHGVRPKTRDSGVVRALYDMAFAYHRGDVRQPSFAAGTLLRCAMRMLFTYRGAIFWKMQAGMGDTIFAPLYRVLKDRGVEFKFFHRVTNLGLSEDQTSVARIDLVRQVDLKQQGAHSGPEYDPLVNINGLDCWPSLPRYDQLADEHARTLIECEIDLEANRPARPEHEAENSPEPANPHESPITLRAGEDFDIVVLGIPLGALPIICKELIDANASWREMVERVETVRTMAMQLWLKPDLEGLGWEHKSPIMDAYEQPLDTWADMSHLIPRENWPAELRPGNLAYFCGPMPDSDGPPETQDEALAKVKETAIDWLRKHTGYLWRRATTAEQPDSLDLEQLIDPNGGVGAQRFEAQFFRANIDPSERYVLSVAGSTRHRLGAADSGCDNLYLAGDWVKTRLNAGCIEAAVMAGMLAASAICGRPRPEEIIG